MVPTLVISGAVGVGKTSAGMELSIELERREIAHTFIDLDALTMTFPRPEDDRFGERLAMRNLADVWRNSAQSAGSRNLIIARVIEDPGQIRNIERAVPGSAVTLVTLTAADEDLRARVRQREIGSARTWHEARSLDLARTLGTADADAVIDTSRRTVRDVATLLVATVEWARS